MELKVVYRTKEGILIEREESIKEWVAELMAGRLDFSTPILYAELDGKNIFHLLPEEGRALGVLLKVLGLDNKMETTKKTTLPSYEPGNIQYWKVPVVWEMMGYLRIPKYIAQTEMEAIDKAIKIAGEGPLPEGEYLVDSFAIGEDIMSRAEERNTLMDKNIGYKTGADFWNDLVKTYGRTEALSMATHYLEIPLPSYNPEDSDYQAESKFRKELLQAIANVR